MVAGGAVAGLERHAVRVGREFAVPPDSTASPDGSLDETEKIRSFLLQMTLCLTGLSRIYSGQTKHSRAPESFR